MRASLAAGGMFAVLNLGGCSGMGGKDGEKEEARPRAELVGRIGSVPASGGFVLIQSYGAWSVPAGEAVFSAGGEGRTANLLPTGEKMGQFLAADLRSGEVEVGDAVYFRPLKQEPLPQVSAPQEVAAEGEEATVADAPGKKPGAPDDPQ